MTEQTKALVDVVNFTQNMIEKELNQLDGTIKELEDAKNTVVSMGAKVPDSIMVEHEKKKRQYQKLINDKLSVERMQTQIARIQGNTALSDEQKQSAIESILNPFFAKYSNSYGGMTETVDVRKGKSQFEQIMEGTETRIKLGEKIEELEKKSAILTAKNIAKGPKKPSKNPYELTKEDKLKYKIRDTRNEQKNEAAKQDLVMASRQDTIDKRNEKISKLEAQAKVADANGNTKKADRKRERIASLKTKKVKTSSGSVMMMKQHFVDFFTKTTYGADGNYDSRGWAERRIDAMDEKKGRGL